MARSDREHPLILVVEDDPDACRIAEGMLRALGCHAAVASTVMEGLFLLREGRPDAVLLDINLPELDGSDFVDMAAEIPEARKIPIVVASAVYSAESDMTRSLRSRGVWRHLSKPFGTNELEKALRQVLPGWSPSGALRDEGRSHSSASEGSTMEIALEGLDIQSLTGVRAIDAADLDVPDTSQEEIIIEEEDAEPAGGFIGPLHATVLKESSRIEVNLKAVSPEDVVIETSQFQARPGDLVRLELRARRLGFDQQIQHVETVLLTRAGSVQRRGVAWEIALAVQAAKPEELWPAIGEIWRV